MHRLHHLHSDTKDDPHSPLNAGFMGVFPAQLRSYIRTLKGLHHGLRKYASIVTDFDFPVHPIHGKGLWFLPHLLHATIAVAIAVIFDAKLLALSYFTGLLCSPLGGWAVNSFGHRYGYRNFETRDNSRNNSAVALLVFGEGFQNNHHEAPASPDFAAAPREIDTGFLLCRLAKALGLVDFVTPIPSEYTPA